MTCGNGNDFNAKPWRTGYLRLECGECGAFANVKNVAIMPLDIDIDGDEIEKARLNAIEPQHDAAPPSESKSDADWLWLRFRITKEQREVVRNALQVVRSMLLEYDDQHEKVKKRTWHGVCLEYICADFMSSYGYFAAEEPGSEAKVDNSLSEVFEDD